MPSIAKAYREGTGPRQVGSRSVPAGGPCARTAASAGCSTGRSIAGRCTPFGRYRFRRP